MDNINDRRNDRGNDRRKGNGSNGRDRNFGNNSNQHNGPGNSGRHRNQQNHENRGGGQGGWHDSPRNEPRRQQETQETYEDSGIRSGTWTNSRFEGGGGGGRQQDHGHGCGDDRRQQNQGAGFGRENQGYQNNPYNGGGNSGKCFRNGQPHQDRGENSQRHFGGSQAYNGRDEGHRGYQGEFQRDHMYQGGYQGDHRQGGNTGYHQGDQRRYQGGSHQGGYHQGGSQGGYNGDFPRGYQGDFQHGQQGGGYDRRNDYGGYGGGFNETPERNSFQNHHNSGWENRGDFRQPPPREYKENSYREVRHDLYENRGYYHQDMRNNRQQGGWSPQNDGQFYGSRNDSEFGGNRFSPRREPYSDNQRNTGGYNNRNNGRNSRNSENSNSGNDNGFGNNRSNGGNQGNFNEKRGKRGGPRNQRGGHRESPFSRPFETPDFSNVEPMNERFSEEPRLKSNTFANAEFSQESPRIPNPIFDESLPAEPQLDSRDTGFSPAEFSSQSEDSPRTPNPISNDSVTVEQRDSRDTDSPSCSNVSTPSIPPAQQLESEEMPSKKKNKNPVVYKPAEEELVQSTSRMTLENNQQQPEEAPAPGAVMVAPKKEKARRDDKEIVRLRSNVYSMHVQKNKIIYRYDVNVKVLTASGREPVGIAKGPRDDSARTERHRICLEALRTALELYRIMNEGQAFVYDGAAIMFSSENLMEGLKPHSGTLTINLEDLPKHVRDQIRISDATGIQIEICPCVDNAAELDISAYEGAHKNRDMGSLDRTWKQFFDMLTNQHAISSGEYTLFGAGKLFSNFAPPKIGKGGQEMYPGANKGIKFIASNDDPNRVLGALVIDAKVGQFFTSQAVLATVGDLMRWRNLPRDFPFKEGARESREWREINNYIKGLRFIYTHGTTEATFVAYGLSRSPIHELQEENFQGQLRPVMERFPHLQRGVNLNWPAVVVRGKIGRKFVNIHYPLEVLIVAPNQRVPLHKQQGLPPRPVVPQERVRTIDNLMAELNLDCRRGANNFLSAFGVTIEPKPMMVDAIVRKKPQISAGKGLVRVDDTTAAFKLESFSQPEKADTVIVVYDCEEQTARNAKTALEKTLISRRMVVQQWHMMKVERVMVNQHRCDFWKSIRNTFDTISNNIKKKMYKGKVVVVYIDDKNQKTHGYLKLLERIKLLLTQHVTTYVAQKMTNSRDTCGNIVNKLNCKLSGLNYNITPDQYSKNAWIKERKDILVVGYDVAHPTGQLRSDRLDNKPPETPSVVGFGFNGGKHPESFIGDFHYQTPRKEEVNDGVLNVRMKWILKLFQKNRGQLPSQIYIIRDGVSEGQYKMVLDREMWAIHQACEEFGAMVGKEQWKPKFVCVVVTKRHNVRLFGGKDFNENAKPGTVVDDTITRGDMTEFYMQSHRVLQGTGKFPSYVVLEDELNLKSDELQSFLLALCFDHQIMGGSISLPEPVYQADEWAKRGNDMWKAYEENFNIPKCEDKKDYSEEPYDFEEMTKRIAYWNTELQETRVNA